MAKPFSLFAFLFIGGVFLIASLLYYPKWKMEKTEATLSWDVSGYYLYLPATFIYQDLKELDFLDTLLQTYQPTPNRQQAYRHASGRYVIKYSLGQAVHWLPFFALAHGFASFSERYPADGFSRPYQLAISLGSLLIALLGLWLLRKVLLAFFSDGLVAGTLLLIALGSNYLDYAAINGAMTHNTLFTLNALLLWLTFCYYQAPSRSKALGIGLVIGLAALTRPTDLVSAVIPLLWGLQMPLWPGIRQRLAFFRAHLSHLALAGLAAVLIGSLQLIYWKYVAGEWLVYSYRDQGFSWLKPHLFDGLFSYKTGWLLYSPLFLFALIGFIPLYRKVQPVFGALLVYFLLFTYPVVAWDEWWYGGGLGNRAMVQSYAALAFPLAAFIQWVQKPRLLAYLTNLAFGLCIVFNLWLTHQAHRGGLYLPGQMNRAYFWEVIGTFRADPQDLKLLDTNERPPRNRREVEVIFEETFESLPDSAFFPCRMAPIEGHRSLCIHTGHPQSQKIALPLSPQPDGWVRIQALFQSKEREWSVWRMHQMKAEFWRGDTRIKDRGLRIFRLLHDYDWKEVYMDISQPDESFDSLKIYFTNGDGTSEKVLLIDKLVVESFRE